MRIILSDKGIKIIASIFTLLQQKRLELMEMGTAKLGTPEGNEDVELAQLLEDMKEATAVKFTKLTTRNR